jgi:thioredoxin 1
MGEGSNLMVGTDANFQKEVLESEQPAIVDFWASWCGPCKMIAPIFEELSTQYTGKVKFVKVNVDENPKTPANYGVRGIPTLIMFKGGKVIDQVVGAVPKGQLENIVKKVLSGGKFRHGLENFTGPGHRGGRRVCRQPGFGENRQHLRSDLQPVPQHGAGGDHRVDDGLRVRPENR